MTLDVKNISIHLGVRPVVKDISFSLAPGGAVCIRGENGSGKTTLLRAVAGLQPISGGAIINRHPLHYVGHASGLKSDLTVAEILHYWCALMAAPFQPFNDDVFGITRLFTRHARELSAGQRQRVALSRVLLAPRELWVLDEPTASLDAAGTEALHALIASHRAAGGMVVVATHEGLELPDTQTIHLYSITANKEAA